MDPVHIFCYCSTTVPNRFAHPIQILKTVRALAEQPGVRVTLYFVSLGTKPRAIWRYYGMKPLPNVRVRGMVPSWYFRLMKLNNHLCPEQQKIFHLVRWRLARELRRVARTERAFIYTRNENAITMMRKSADAAGIPMYLELHWFKHLDWFRKLPWNQSREVAPPPIGEYKRLLRKLKANEREVLNQADGILCLTDEIRKVLSRWNLKCPLTTLPSGVELIAPEELRANGVEPAGLESDDSEEEVAAGGDLGGADDGDDPADGDAAQDEAIATTDTSPPNRTPLDILYLGQLYPWKGVDLLVQAMAHLPEYRLTIVGGNRDKDKNRVKSLARELGVNGRVNLVGHISHPKVKRYIRKARVCVVPLPRAGYREARFFTSPMKLFEFAAWGKVIVASDLPTLREVLTHGQNALLVRPDDPVALAEGLREALENQPLREQLAAGALKLAQDHAYENRARRILEFCRPGGKVTA